MPSSMSVDFTYNTCVLCASHSPDMLEPCVCNIRSLQAVLHLQLLIHWYAEVGCDVLLQDCPVPYPHMAGQNTMSGVRHIIVNRRVHAPMCCAALSTNCALQSLQSLLSQVLTELLPNLEAWRPVVSYEIKPICRVWSLCLDLSSFCAGSECPRL